jgi:hypothetical protein
MELSAASVRDVRLPPSISDSKKCPWHIALSEMSEMSDLKFKLVIQRGYFIRIRVGRGHYNFSEEVGHFKKRIGGFISDISDSRTKPLFMGTSEPLSCPRCFSIISDRLMGAPLTPGSGPNL